MTPAVTDSGIEPGALDASGLYLSVSLSSPPLEGNLHTAEPPQNPERFTHTSCGA
jgi:hypothetical protein